MKNTKIWIFLIFFVIFISISFASALVSPITMEQRIKNSQEHLIGEVIKIIDIPDHHKCFDDKYAEIRILEVIKTTNNLSVNQIIKIGFSDNPRKFLCTTAFPYVAIKEKDKIKFYADKINETTIQNIYPQAEYVFSAGGYKLEVLEREAKQKISFFPILNFFKILFGIK